MTSAVERPWYQQFWVWFVIAIPACAIFFSLQFVYIAVTHKDPVVRGDWYEDGKTINESFARNERALGLGLSADIRFDDTTGEVLLTLRARQPIEAPTLELNFVHATQTMRDQRLVLQRLMGNEYRGQLARPLDGIFQVELSTPEWRLHGTRSLPSAEVLNLTAL